ncbi:hypothetical protein VCR15J2_390067 [Vibrio coralliirubri]|uniref:hypothetical protein n=1 Tax=Vibrio coralliirubri TaxID=1516159 RepID=UPI0006377464|nr:hypothetical protein [Vibrio coralliirubri]CDT53413.1 hypothetical protein VCR15J2_390067 [Vibrio coralliirubri]
MSVSTATAKSQENELDALLADLDIEELEADAPVTTPVKADDASEELDELLDGIDELVLEGADDSEVEAKSDIVLDDLDDELEELLASDPATQDNTELYEEDEVEEDEVLAKPETKTSEVESNKKKAANKKIPTEDESSEEPVAKPETKKTAAKRGPGVSGLSKSEAVKVKLGESINTHMVLVKADTEVEDMTGLINSRLNDIDKLPKKVGEKVLNMFQHLNSGVALSVYTDIALDMLFKNGTLSSTELRDRYQEKYSKGTASAQSSQLMQVINFMKIGTLAGKTLTLNPDSVLAEKLNTEA